MKKAIIALAVVVVLLAAMVLTRPTERDHQRALTDVACKNVENVTGGLLDLRGLGKKAVNTVVGWIIDTEDYWLFSVSRLSFNDQVVGVGVFGHVFTVSETALSDAIDKEIEEMGLPKPIEDGLNLLLPWRGND